MSSFNKVLLMGNLTRDVEVVAAGGGTVSKFGLALNEKYTNREGREVENVTFLDCEMWGNRGEAFAKYHAKGDRVFIEGSLVQDNWEDKDGNKRSKIKVKAFGFEFVKSDGGKASGTAEPKPGGKTWQSPPPDDLPF